MSNSWNVGTDGILTLLRDLERMGDLGQRNATLAGQDTALWAREQLRQATKGPKSRAAASVADLWRVENEPKGASVVNPSETAVYLEYGVGIYNEGPGLRGPIVPRRARHSAWANAYRARTGKEPPMLLFWKDEDTGKWIAAKQVKGFKAVRMVRNNMPRIERAYIRALESAIASTLRGDTYV